MRIIQVSNLVSHHQLPLARELARLVGEENFRFCATQVPDPERLRLGWLSQDDEAWIIRAGERESDKIQFEQWWDSADVVICGERRFERMADRVAMGKLCFYMSERWWKPPIGMARLLHPMFLNMAMQFYKISKSPFFHYLPVGPFAERDISFLSNFKERMWRWGYFTDIHESAQHLRSLSGKLRVLWVGRMLDWKRVSTLLLALAELETNHVAFELTLIGNGKERIRLEKMASKLLHCQSYSFREPVPAADVPQIMSQNDIYVLPSSAYEGWGAVVNEAMDCGCAVVASDATGAAAAMIEDGVNGLLFKPGDWVALANLLKQLASNGDLRKNLANAAQRTIHEIWSPHVVAERFCNVSGALLANRDVPVYTSGPMSRSGF